jgi:hypothetical protein
MSTLKLVLAACATDWSRKEKRLDEIISFAKMYPEVSILLIGDINEQPLPDNIVPVYYVKEPSGIAAMLNLSDGFINLSYRDPATKTIPQSISCGLPVLYANSGGVGELAGEYGIPIKDDTSLGVLDHVPALDADNIAEGYSIFRKEFVNIKDKLVGFDSELAFRKMLDGYFSVIIDAGRTGKNEEAYKEGNQS